MHLASRRWIRRRAATRRLPALAGLPATDAAGAWPQIPAEQIVAIGYTCNCSASEPNASAKSWRSFHASTAGDLVMLRSAVNGPFSMVATVPPQHMYGMEMSVLLPLLGGHGVHAGRPYFPADVAAALTSRFLPRACW